MRRRALQRRLNYAFLFMRASGPQLREIASLIDAGAIPAQPIEPLAHVLMGALDEAALYVALADDPGRARREVGVVLRRMLVAITAPP